MSLIWFFTKLIGNVNEPIEWKLKQLDISVMQFISLKSVIWDLIKYSPILVPYVRICNVYVSICKPKRSWSKMTTLIMINIVGNLNLPNYNQRYKMYRNISIDLLIVLVTTPRTPKFLFAVKSEHGSLFGRTAVPDHVTLRFKFGTFRARRIWTVAANFADPSTTANNSLIWYHLIINDTISFHNNTYLNVQHVEIPKTFIFTMILK